MAISNAGFMARVLPKRKQGGFALAAELTLVSSLLVAGATVGVTTLRDSLLIAPSDKAEFVNSPYEVLAAASTSDRIVVGDGVRFVFVPEEDIAADL